jgi:hypothetical protein
VCGMSSPRVAQHVHMARGTPSCTVEVRRVARAEHARWGSACTPLSHVALAAVTPALTLRVASHHAEIGRVTSCRALELPRSFALPPLLSRRQIHVGCIKARSQVWHNTCYPVEKSNTLGDRQRSLGRSGCMTSIESSMARRNAWQSTNPEKPESMSDP